MEQRTYRGSVSPAGLADYLVNPLNSGCGMVAQKVGQVVCAGCRQTVSAGRYCSNRGAPLAGAGVPS